MQCRGWLQEAALRCLRNNLDPAVAERPEDLVVYGGSREGWRAVGTLNWRAALRRAYGPRREWLARRALRPHLRPRGVARGLLGPAPRRDPGGPEAYELSVFGYLDASADTQWIRVMPMRAALPTAPGGSAAKVTVEHLGTGRVFELRIKGDAAAKFDDADAPEGDPGEILTLDLLLFYVFFELTLIPMFFIIGIWGGPRRVYAAVKFFLFTMFGSLLMLVAILVLYYLHAEQFITDVVKNYQRKTFDELKAKYHSLDLLLIDGPPWTIHPYVRGAAETLFDRLPVGGVVMLDDGARPGERVVAQRWRKRWPNFRFDLVNRGTKGTLIGQRLS